MTPKRGLQTLVVALAGLLWAAATALSRAQGFPQWVNFYSENSTFDGEPVPVGGVVAAYDPTGVECGTSTVAVPGVYSLLSCRKDEPDTSEDEGAEPGDVISFSINGPSTTAVPIEFNFTSVPPSTPITWTGNGDLWKVDLSACTLEGDLDCNCRVDVADIQRVAGRWGISKGQPGYYPPYDADGDGIDAGDIQRVAMNWRNSCQ